MSEMLWGGRFARPPDPDMLRLTSSIAIDAALFDTDIAATKAHGRALAKAGLLDDASLTALEKACNEMLAEWREGSLGPSATDEDVHSLVEHVLTERLGEAGARIHAGRSRNDLVATDMRMWCKGAAADLAARTTGLIDVLTQRAEEHADAIMPGYTHLQRAQPVSMGFHLLGHGFALLRDVIRFDAARAASDECPLGAGALAGTTLQLDASFVAAELGFSRSFDNALDAVSQRDFVCDLLYAIALCGVHLSRLAEEIVLWSGAEFGFVILPDEWSTGSSMMPQKRNPDLAELVRARAARGIGDLTSVLALLKGLPLGYNRDLQEDKAVLFPAVERTAGCLEGMASLTGKMGFDRGRMAAAASDTGLVATDLAERMVAAGMPFRAAHHAVGRAVAALETGASDAEVAANVRLLEEMAATPSLDRRAATAPVNVASAARDLRRRAGALVAAAGAPPRKSP